MYPKGYGDTYSPMFIATLFLIARNWKHPRCPSSDASVMKLWYIFTVEYYSALEKNKIINLTGKWVKLEGIILSEVTRTQKDKYSMLPLAYGC